MRPLRSPPAEAGQSGSEGEQLAYSQASDYELLPVDEYEEHDEYGAAADRSAPLSRRSLLIGNAVVAFAVIGFASLAVAVAVTIRPTAASKPVEGHQNAQPGKFMPLLPTQQQAPVPPPPPDDPTAGFQGGTIPAVQNVVPRPGTSPGVGGTPASPAPEAPAVPGVVPAPVPIPVPIIIPPVPGLAAWNADHPHRTADDAGDHVGDDAADHAADHAGDHAANDAADHAGDHATNDRRPDDRRPDDGRSDHRRPDHGRSSHRHADDRRSAADAAAHATTNPTDANPAADRGPADGGAGSAAAVRWPQRQRRGRLIRRVLITVAASLRSEDMAGDAVTVVLPCLNEEESLPAVLAAIPAGYRALVVDNNSTDDTATVAARHGAQVVVEPRPGYGSAVHAGVLAATTPIVAVIDADGSMDAGDLPKLVAELDKGADLVTGRRRPVAGLHWPWVARVGTVVMSWRLRTRHRLPVHDIAPMRVARREALLDLGVVDRRSGYPLELLVRAAAAGWRVVELDVSYGPRTGGKSKVSGSLRGSIIAILDFWKVIS